MSQYDKDLKSKLDSISESFIKGEKNGALTVINRLMKENRVHQYTHGALIGAINIIGDELRGQK